MQKIFECEYELPVTALVAMPTDKGCVWPYARPGEAPLDWRIGGWAATCRVRVRRDM